MVATTVIEVGVNVPNASVMVIENTERFGLSQLHQLRGRVGRGADQSYCILMTDYKVSKEGKERIATMVRTNNGFEIAEADLKLRGPGDIQGTQQSGLLDFKLLNIGQDKDVYKRQEEAARRGQARRARRGRGPAPADAVGARALGAQGRDQGARCREPGRQAEERGQGDLSGRRVGRAST